ncbi:MAG: dipeptidase [Thermoanaerobaculia bacterium]|nr:MAG: dipeptidase [Thermoanaerobaculia bacterium]
MAHDTQDVFARIEREKATYLAELKDYLRIPSISTDPAYKTEVGRAADWLIERMKEAGLTTEKITTAGHPLVYAEWTGAGPDQPTVLFYGHYDVQPPDPLGEWRNPPFEPTEEGEQLVARGATDDKGQSYTHLKAVAAMLAERGRLPVNVKFIVEGEEEAGGEAVDAFVRADRGRKLGCSCVVVSDTSMWAPGEPAITYGLKGLAYFEIRVQGPNRDLHSGVYGGGVANPGNALATILAALKDPKTGKIKVPGFYDAVRPLAEWERKEFKKLGLDEKEVAADLAVDALPGEKGFSYIERTWARPTCDVNGLWCGYQGKGAKTVLPAAAGCKVSFRLVADQTPAQIAELVRAHVASVTPPGVKVEVDYLHGAEAVTVDATGVYAQAALDALEEVWGKRPVRIRTGGSIPIVGTFTAALGVPVLMLGFGLEEDRLHSPNEKFDIPNFYGGIRSVARLLDRLAGVGA